MATLNTDQLLAERGKTHGEYAEHARCTQALLRVMQEERNWPILSDMQKETLHMIAHKIGRIMTGNPDVQDHYDDIAGYARLISQRLVEQPPVFDITEDIIAALAVGLNVTKQSLIDAGVKVHFTPAEEVNAQEIMKQDILGRSPNPAHTGPTPEDGARAVK